MPKLITFSSSFMVGRNTVTSKCLRCPPFASYQQKNHTKNLAVSSKQDDIFETTSVQWQRGIWNHLLPVCHKQSEQQTTVFSYLHQPELPDHKKKLKNLWLNGRELLAWKKPRRKRLGLEEGGGEEWGEEEGGGGGGKSSWELGVHIKR